MRTNELMIGMKVAHPQYGEGRVKAIEEQSATVQFGDGPKKLDPGILEPRQVESQVRIEGEVMVLSGFLKEVVMKTIAMVEEAKAAEDDIVEQLGSRWQQGTLVLRPSDSQLQPKEVPLEKFFHKIVMLRDNLRVMEQKINSHPALSDADKIELQQYITRIYGSLTTFNILFKHKDGQFVGQAS